MKRISLQELCYKDTMMHNNTDFIKKKKSRDPSLYIIALVYALVCLYMCVYQTIQWYHYYSIDGEYQQIHTFIDEQKKASSLLKKKKAEKERLAFQCQKMHKKPAICYKIFSYIYKHTPEDICLMSLKTFYQSQRISCTCESKDIQKLFMYVKHLQNDAHVTDMQIHNISTRLYKKHFKRYICTFTCTYNV
jgi:cell division protein FtsL